MRLPKDLAKCVVYLFPEKISAEDGECSGAATAFWVEVMANFSRYTFLVTNAHVIDEGVTVARWTAVDGSNQILDIEKCNWIRNPDKNVDVDVAFIKNPNNVDALLLKSSIFINKSSIIDLEMRLGDDVAMLGLHRNYHGKLTNMPTARFGHLVQFPAEEIEDDRKRRQSVFLAQIPSLPGFSGSPVFLIQDEGEKEKEKSIISGSPPRNIRLLGVNCGHLHAYSDTVRSENKMRNDNLLAEVNSGIIYICPAWKILDTLNNAMLGVKNSPGFSQSNGLSPWMTR